MPRQGPDFTSFSPIQVTSVRTGETATLVRADSVAAIPALVEEITGICNEPLIYDTLFRRSLRGEPYSISRAQDFRKGARQGWAANNRFVLLVWGHWRPLSPSYSRRA